MGSNKHDFDRDESLANADYATQTWNDCRRLLQGLFRKNETKASRRIGTSTNQDISFSSLR